MAKRFVFRLEPLSKIRRARQSEQQRVVAERLLVVQRCVEMVAMLEGRLRSAEEDMRSSRAGGVVDAVFQMQGQRFREFMIRRIAGARRSLEQADASLVGARQELGRRSTELKAIENLRRRRLEEYVREQERAEIIELNEVGVQTFLRSRAETHVLMEAGG